MNDMYPSRQFESRTASQPLASDKIPQWNSGILSELSELKQINPVIEKVELERFQDSHANVPVVISKFLPSIKKCRRNPKLSQ